MNSQEILVEIRSGNSTKSLESLYAYYPKVEGYILKNSGTPEEAKDIFQESIVIFYQNALEPDFELTSNPNTYVFAIAKRLWYGKLRKNNKELPLAAEPSESFQEVDEYEEKETLFEHLDVIIQQLGEKCQAIFKLYYYMKKSMKEIAESLSYNSVNAAKTQKYKCMERAKRKAAERLNHVKS